MNVDHELTQPDFILQNIYELVLESRLSHKIVDLSFSITSYDIELAVMGAS